MKLRKIVPMQLPDTERAVVTGPRPELKWVEPTDLLVDASYQRDLTTTSVKLIRTIVKEFAWSRIKPPCAARVDGGYHVIDGQHTAIAAASLGLAEIPVFVVTAPEVVERARAFVSHNRNRLAISALDIHRALVAGGDPLAASIQKTLDDVGVSLRYFSGGQAIKVGDCQSIANVVRLFRRHGVAQSRKVFAALVQAKCAPIVEPHIWAAHELILDGADARRLAAAIRVGLENDLIRARAKAATEGSRAWQALKMIWQRRLGGSQ